MAFDLEIIGSTLVTPEGVQRGTIAIRNGRIAAFPEEPSGSATRKIDATGLMVLPRRIESRPPSGLSWFGKA